MTYINGAVIPVKDGNREKYRKICGPMTEAFIEHGAISTMDAWGVDVAEGQVTDFRRAVAAEDGESIVLSWILWPDKATADAAWEKLRTDPRVNLAEAPFDGMRMIFGGFESIFEAKRAQKP